MPHCQDDTDKLWKMVDNPDIQFNLYANYDDFCEALVFFVNRSWILRRHNEPINLRVPNVHFFESVTGKRMVELSHLRKAKKGTLSMANTSFTTGLKNSVLEDPKNV